MLTRHIPPSITPWSRWYSSLNPALVPWLCGERVAPHDRSVSLPSKTGGQEDRGSLPTHGTFPRLRWASPDRCAHMDKPASQLPSPLLVVHASAPLRWAMGVVRDHCPCQEERQKVLGCGQLSMVKVPIRGVFLRGFPADKTGNSLCAPQLVWPCSSP